MKEYLFPIEKVTSYFKSINSKEDLQKFIQQRSAHITQNTLYGYLKTRMGHKFTIMVDDDVFSQINKYCKVEYLYGRFSRLHILCFFLS
jgi:hypothetical protein